MAAPTIHIQVFPSEGKRSCLVIEVFSIAIHPIMAAQAARAKCRCMGRGKLCIDCLVASRTRFNIETRQAFWMAFAAGKAASVGVLLMGLDRKP